MSTLKEISFKELVRAEYPQLDAMPFCDALRKGRFKRADILRAEVVEVYRAQDTRDRIQKIYKAKLTQSLAKGEVAAQDVAKMEEVIDDEGETEEHIDHLDMRFKLFTGTHVTNKSRPHFDGQLQAINDEWVNICEESDLITLMALTAAIEDWYAPLSSFFEAEYRKRGFSDEELELFIVHKGTDVDHSEAQFDILGRSGKGADRGKVQAMLRRTFATSRAYDAAKLRLAESSAPLETLIK